MKILFFADVEPTGGTGTFFFRMLDFLRDKNQITVFVDHDNYSKPDFLFKMQNYPEIRIKLFNPFYRIENFILQLFIYHLRLFPQYLYFRDLIQIKRLSKMYKPDLLLFSQGGGTKWFPAFGIKIPVLFFIHSVFSEIDNFSKKQLKKIPFHPNHKIINVSNYATKEFCNTIGSNSLNRSAITIPNFALENSINIQDTSKRNGFIIILTIGHLYEWKNPELWYEIAVEITKKYKNVKFIWAGIGKLYNSLKVKTAFNPQINYIGYIKDTNSLYNNSDIYFQPSLLESQGIAVIEAMSHKLPCVVSNAGGLPESVISGKTGYICDMLDKNSYIKCLNTLIEETTLRKTFGENGFLLYKEKFSFTVWEKLFNNTINDIINTGVNANK